MKTNRKFLTIGLIAIVSLFMTDKVINNLSLTEAQTYFNEAQQMEKLDVDVKARRDTYITSHAELYPTQAQSWHANVQLGFFITNVLKLLSPIESLKTNTKAYYLYVAFHEFSHAQLNHFFVEGKPVFQLHDSHLTESEEKLVNEKMNNFYRNIGQSNLLVSHFHENFADTYGAILLLRHSTYSTQQVRQAIKARYNQTKHQREFVFGALGDIEHRTDKSLEILLTQNLDNIKNMSYEQALNLAFNIATQGTIKALPEAYASLFESKALKHQMSKGTIEKLVHYARAPIYNETEKTQSTSLAKI